MGSGTGDLPVGFYGAGSKFPSPDVFSSPNPVWGRWGALPRTRSRGRGAQHPPAAVPAAPRPLLPGHDSSCPSLLVPACACPSCPPCLFLLLLPVPACTPPPPPPACPLGLATRQPLKLGPLIAGRELIDIYWGLHPLAADPFIFNKEEESCLPWEMGQ